MNWITWNGGECPVPKGTIVDVIHRDGEMVLNVPAGVNIEGHRAEKWSHLGVDGDIILYRTKYNGRELSSWETLNDEQGRPIWRPEVKTWQ